ncbi:hypothetical protein ACQ4M3_11235 [Leptolyngbya sp. AN03gr2]|uniref:hypothetical protein n=1 Tax=unclassified Leptolyngbya TaxID=2650499 RepID=UPI003D31E309
MWKIIAGVLLSLGVGAAIVLKLINNAVAEFYSPGFISNSVSDARSRGVLIAQPRLESNVIRWKGSEYAIRSAWIEQATRIKYDWIFFERVIPTGYRLVLAIDRTGNPPGESFLYFMDGLVCNDSIQINATRPEDPLLMYGEFSAEIPESINCMIRNPN